MVRSVVSDGHVEEGACDVPDCVVRRLEGVIIDGPFGGKARRGGEVEGE